MRKVPKERGQKTPQIGCFGLRCISGGVRSFLFYTWILPCKCSLQSARITIELRQQETIDSIVCFPRMYSTATLCFGIDHDSIVEFCLCNLVEKL